MSLSNPQKLSKDIQPGSATLFVSDLHLCPSRPAIVGLFLDFLAGPARQANAVYILGDLFEYWAGDDDLSAPFNAQICAAMNACPTPLFFIAGNRDFLIGAEFAKASGVTLLADEVVHEIAGTPTLLLHGDTLCTDDTAYQAFRREIRSPAWRRNFLSLPLAERKTQIETLRRQSEVDKQYKPTSIMDTNASAVQEAFLRHGVQRMIHGHTHRLARHAETLAHGSAERFVLGDWHDSGNALSCTKSGCEFVRLSLTTHL